MNFSAFLNGTTATIVQTTNSGTATLHVEDAASLGDQLLAFATAPSTEAVDANPAYYLDPTDIGVRIVTSFGSLDLPWRWVHSIGTTLAA